MASDQEIISRDAVVIEDDRTGTSQETLRQLQSANSYRLAQKEAAIAAARSRIDEASAKPISAITTS